MRRFLFALACLWLSLAASGIDFRTERIFIAPSDSDYAPGDSISVMGIVVPSDTVTTPYSRYLYLEVMNRNDSVLLRQKLACDSLGGSTTVSRLTCCGHPTSIT